MRLVIISGRSGSGKSSALHVLEDQGFYCVDNMPAGLLGSLAEEISREQALRNAAVSIDARNMHADLKRFPQILTQLTESGVQCEVIYLDADPATLLKRFSETRRRHPLSNEKCSLEEAIRAESELLSPLKNRAKLTLDTSSLSLHELRDLVRTRVAGRKDGSLALLFQSFGFKRGIPIDADYVFDVRCLPNPYWVPHLRGFSGLDSPVQEFLAEQPEVQQMMVDIGDFVERWLPAFEAGNRSYMTVAIGCTGGHHRSVYISEQLTQRFSKRISNVQVRHRELHPAQEQ
ncbi:RNase adapter RapZ [Aestuariirhabdus litorea]|uniref:RNase adapter RapZ n=1 Tax=Aestuariirhabdus litorea TaxID=2528527 RepID=A0A3P3VUU5_9GAMM|nr:RNase adapter RapZ [Aestuariirhabdus litorea]RRJ85396.1 RNase adapter RapZ [Aestuariirhabdus litorea]RWW96939.1 RNase adapter RapZ [Endozoicomonadaceae bacterium GTF-13]